MKHKERGPLFAPFESVRTSIRESGRVLMKYESLRRKERWHVARCRMRVPVPPWFPRCVNTSRPRDNVGVVDPVAERIFRRSMSDFLFSLFNTARECLMPSPDAH